MKLHYLALAAAALCAVASGQENPNDQVRRLRFRRPRPRVVGVENEEGVAQGRPVPLRSNSAQNTAQLLQEAVEPRRPRPGQSLQPTDALQSLLATAAGAPEEEERPAFRPREEPQRAFLPVPIQEEEQFIEEEIPVTAAPRPAARRPAASAGRTRAPPAVPRRRPRPEPQVLEQEIDQDVRVKGARRPSRPRGGARDEEEVKPVGTSERYSHQNEDGSFTFGYIAEDGSFREETRGTDCITRGKYGYIDPDGKRREFTYTSGLPCDEDAEVEENEEGETIIEDPIDPADRFRTSQAVQLSEDEIPAARQRQRQRVRIERPQGAPRDPALRRPAGDSNALNNLLNVAGQEASAALPASRPRPRPRPANARPTLNARPTGNSFDFDDEFQNFQARPALQFDERPRNPAAAQAATPTPAAAPKPVGASFSSELVFDPSTGTFQTELRQATPTGQIRTANPAAPSGRRPTTTAARPTPTPARPAFQPTPSSPGPIKFEPLSFPDPATLPATPAPRPPTPARPATPAPRPPTPARPATPAPRPPTPAPTPTGSFFFQPFPQGQGQPPRPAAPQAPRAPQAPAGSSFINFGARPAVGQPQPVRPQPVPQATPQPQAARPQPTPQLQFGFNPITQQVGPIQPGQATRPVAQAPRPAQPQQPRPQPFTAFGQPPQRPVAGAPRPVPPQPFRPGQPQPFRPGQPQQFGFPGQPQAPRQLGIPPQLQQQQPRFLPQGARPAPRPGQPQQPGNPGQFAVFNPNAFRG